MTRNDPAMTLCSSTRIVTASAGLSFLNSLMDNILSLFSSPSGIVSRMIGFRIVNNCKENILVVLWKDDIYVERFNIC